MIDEAPIDNVPAFVTVTPPPLVVVTLLLMAKLLPIKPMPPAAVVDSGPLKVVVPVPAVCEIEAAVMALAVTLVCPLNVRLLSGNPPPPTAPVSVMLPVPANKTRLCVPLRVLENVISPTPEPVLRFTSEVRVTGPAKDIKALFVVMLAPRLTAPVPVC